MTCPRSHSCRDKIQIEVTERSNALLPLSWTRPSKAKDKGRGKAPSPPMLPHSCWVPVLSTRKYLARSVEVTTLATSSRGVSLASVVIVQFMKCPTITR